MTSERGRLRTAWDEFVGPEATAVENTMTLGTGLAGLVVAPSLTAAARALPLGEALLLRTPRRGPVGRSGGEQHAGLRPLVRAARTDRRRPPALRRRPPASAAGRRARPPRTGGRVPGLVWAAGHYGYLMLATALVRRARRSAAAGGGGADAGRDRARPGARTGRGGTVVRAGLLRQAAARPRRSRTLVVAGPVRSVPSAPVRVGTRTQADVAVGGSRAGSQPSSSTARSKA